MSDENNNVSRAEHLAWCKARAMAYVDAGDFTQAFASMCSDLRKHPETEAHCATTNLLGFELLAGGHLDSRVEMTKWIQGYN